MRVLHTKKICFLDKFGKYYIKSRGFCKVALRRIGRNYNLKSRYLTKLENQSLAECLWNAKHAVFND